MQVIQNHNFWYHKSIRWSGRRASHAMSNSCWWLMLRGMAFVTQLQMCVNVVVYTASSHKWSEILLQEYIIKERREYRMCPCSTLNVCWESLDWNAKCLMTISTYVNEYSHSKREILYIHSIHCIGESDTLLSLLLRMYSWFLVLGWESNGWNQLRLNQFRYRRLCNKYSQLDKCNCHRTSMWVILPLTCLLGQCWCFCNEPTLNVHTYMCAHVGVQVRLGDDKQLDATSSLSFWLRLLIEHFHSFIQPFGTNVSYTLVYTLTRSQY